MASANLRTRVKHASAYLRAGYVTGEQCEQLLRALADGVLITDPDGHVLEANDALSRITGYPREEIVGRQPAELPFWTPGDHERVASARADAIAAGGGQFEARLMHRDGSTRHTIIALAPYTADAREPTIVLTIKDVTEQHLLRERLRDERDRAEAILDTMREGFGLITDGVIVDVNPALCEITGFSRQQLIGHGLPFPFWPEDLHEELWARVGEIREEGGTLEVVFQRADGTRFHAETTAVPIRGTNGAVTGFLNSVRDISERKLHEQALEERNAQLAAMADMTRALAHSAPEAARNMVCETARDVTGATLVGLWESDDEDVLHLTASLGAIVPEGTPAGQARAVALGRVYTSGQALFAAEVGGDSAGSSIFKIVSAHLEPVIADGRVIGVLAVGWDTPRPSLGADLEQLMPILAHEASFAIERATIHARLELLARTDALTALPNRRVLEELFPREIAAAKRTGSALTLAFVDLDHFKEFNDTFGHPAGDRFLKTLSTAWSDRIRETDLLVRWGGEEFCLLLPGCTADEAAGRLDELRLLIPAGQTFSAGVVEWTPGASPGTLLELADRALYAAKRNGRDCNVVAQTPDVLAA